MQNQVALTQWWDKKHVPGWGDKTGFVLEVQPPDSSFNTIVYDADPKIYWLPEGYAVGESMDGTIGIFRESDGRGVDIEAYKGKPAFNDGGNLYVLTESL